MSAEPKLTDWQMGRHIPGRDPHELRRDGHRVYGVWHAESAINGYRHYICPPGWFPVDQKQHLASIMASRPDLSFVD